MTIKDLITKFYEVDSQIQNYHRNTFSFSEHTALGSFYEDFAELKDEFIEVYNGKYNRINTSFINTVMEYNEGASMAYLRAFQTTLINDARIWIPKDTELNNILDEILALTDRTIFLLTLK